MKLTKNFSKSEFECKCGCEMPEEVLDNIKLLSIQLQFIRDHFNEPIKINSAYRCIKHNQAIGGVSRSQHVLGKASDIRITGMNSGRVADGIEHLVSEGCLDIKGLGRYDNFTHVDIRENYARWNNTSK
tara:strand:+ start:455 stop:841 length:387 start_codon:yes stop_codon:yes gene_type:complete